MDHFLLDIVVDKSQYCSHFKFLISRSKRFLNIGYDAIWELDWSVDSNNFLKKASLIMFYVFNIYILLQTYKIITIEVNETIKSQVGIRLANVRFLR